MQQEPHPVRNFLLVNGISSAAALWAAGLANFIWPAQPFLVVLASGISLHIALTRSLAAPPQVSR